MIEPATDTGNAAASRESIFPATRWSLVLRAGETGSGAERSAALEEICRRYYQPLYSYARRVGNNMHDASDLTQGFFVYLLEKNLFGRADPDRGKLRGLLLTSFKHYIRAEWQHGRAAKRGGDREFVPLDLKRGEVAYLEDAAAVESPDRAYDRRWALALLERVFERLRKEYRAGGREALFEALRGYLLSEPTEGGYAELAQGLGMTEGSVRTGAYRLRQRYRELFRDEIARTVEDPSAVDEEIRHLRQALSGR